MNGLLGVIRNQYGDELDCPDKKVEEVDTERIEALLAERATAKAAKDYARSDAIRQQLDAEGIEVRDTPEGVVWTRKASD